MAGFDWAGFWAGAETFFAAPPDWFRLLLILAVAIALRYVLKFVISRVVNQIVSGVKRRHRAEDTAALHSSPLAAVRIVQRTRTLGSLLNNVVATVIVLIVIILFIAILVPGASAAFALVTAAVGAGLGFGAQNLIKDALNGLFMVVEDQLGVGDAVDLGPATGVVEAVGIRVTQIRDVNGTLWFVRNGEILRVGNMSQGWARVIIDLAVPYESDLDAVQERMLTTARELADTPKWRRLILEKPEIWGLESISAEALVIRLVVKTRSGEKDTVARELRIRLKRALDAMGVHLPALNSIVLSGFDGAASVRGARTPKTKPIEVPEPQQAPAAKSSRRKARQ